jgi:RNA polymerase sigma factor (sigma-70 family)
MNTPPTPRPPQGIEASMQQFITTVDHAVQLLPHDDVAAATEAIADAGALLQQAAEGSASPALTEIVMITEEAARGAERAGIYLRTGAVALGAYVRDISGQSTAETAPPVSVTGDAAMTVPPGAAETPGKQSRPIPPEIIQAADAAAEQLTPLASLPSKTAYTEALQTYPDDVLCELLRRNTLGVAETLVQRHKPFMIKRAKELLASNDDYKRGLDYDDLIDEAVIQFLQGCKRFAGGNTLLAFAGQHIYGGMYTVLNIESYTVPVPIGLQERALVKIIQIDRQRSREALPPLTDAEIAEMFDMSIDAHNRGDHYPNALTVADVRRALKLTYGMKSLDRLIDVGEDFVDEMDASTSPEARLRNRPVQDGDPSFTDLTGGEQPPQPEEHALRMALSSQMQSAIATLPEMQRRVITIYFGIGREQRNLREISEELGISTQYVHLLKNKALKSLAEAWRGLQVFVSDD